MLTADFATTGATAATTTTTTTTTALRYFSQNYNCFQRASETSRCSETSPRPSALAVPGLTGGLSGLMPAKHFYLLQCSSLSKKKKKNNNTQSHKKRDTGSVYEGLKGREWEEACARTCAWVFVCLWARAYVSVCVHSLCIDLCVCVCVCVSWRVCVCVCVCLSAQCRWVAEWLLQPNDSVC